MPKSGTSILNIKSVLQVLHEAVTKFITASNLKVFELITKSNLVNIKFEAVIKYILSCKKMKIHAQNHSHSKFSHFNKHLSNHQA